MFVPMKVILDDAHANGYAVVAANVVNMEMVRGVVAAATDLDSPIILQIGPGQMSSHGDGRAISAMAREFAGRTHIPIALHLDHGKTDRAISFAFRNGFSSIMFDGSQYPFEENVRRTKAVVDLAHREGVTVEGELGHVGMADQKDYARYDMYTDPAEAKRFADATGIDAIAVAFGTAHGKYPANHVPVLDFDRLKAIKAAVDMPVVMHGGSASGDDNIRQAVACGVNKINVATDTFVACRDAVAAATRAEPGIDFIKLLNVLEKAARDTIAGYIALMGSASRAAAFKPWYDGHRVFSLGAAKAHE
jgi:fructose-bisphosphate aldolase class II